LALAIDKRKASMDTKELKEIMEYVYSLNYVDMTDKEKNLFVIIVKLLNGLKKTLEEKQELIETIEEKQV